MFAVAEQGTRQESQAEDVDRLMRIGRQRQVAEHVRKDEEKSEAGRNHFFAARSSSMLFSSDVVLGDVMEGHFDRGLDPGSASAASCGRSRPSR